MKKQQFNVYLDPPYRLTLDHFKGQGGKLIRMGLDNLPDKEFQRVLTKYKGEYGPTKEPKVRRTQAPKQFNLEISDIDRAIADEFID